eukprot:Lithocolla_globosa_v1_NODE_230_length_4989_cov_19.803405.p2 type:complete len:323 gc:universal NODE_230_length_4989_cov_19.803405:3135-4103(+)
MRRLDGMYSPKKLKLDPLLDNLWYYHNGIGRILRTYTYKENSCHLDTFLECMWSCRAAIQHLIDSCPKPSSIDDTATFIQSSPIMDDDISPLVLVLLWHRQQVGYGCHSLRNVFRNRVSLAVPTLWHVNPNCLESKGMSNLHTWINHCRSIFGWGYTSTKGCECCPTHHRTEILPRDLVLEVNCRVDNPSNALSNYVYDLRNPPAKTMCEYILTRDRSACQLHKEEHPDHFVCRRCELCRDCKYVRCPHDSKQSFSPVTAWPPILTIYYTELRNLEPTVSFPGLDDALITYKVCGVGRFGSAHFISYNLESSRGDPGPLMTC